jgi:hypothetical protein
MADDNKITHVMRAPLPWRPAKLTECGLLAHEHPTSSVEDFIAKVKREGQQRASYSTCMTCWNAAKRHFGDRFYSMHPIERELQWSKSRSARSGAKGPTIIDELTAIGELVERHRDEFNAILVQQAQTVRVNGMPGKEGLLS